jgi:hypothetical protein
MNKKISTKVAILVIVVFSLAVCGVIIAISFLQNFSNKGSEIAPILQRSDLRKESKVNKSDSSQVPKRFSGSDCYIKDKEGNDDLGSLSADFNLDDANTKVKYENEDKGISFDIPYNAKWGNKNCKVKPYTEFVQPSGDALVEFGKPQAWIPSEFRLTISPYRSSGDIINELNSSTEEPKVQPIKKMIAENQVVSWKSSEAYPMLSYEVVGKQYNYRFDCIGSDSQSEGKKLENIIASANVSNTNSGNNQVQVSFRDSNYIVSAPLAISVSDVTKKATEIAGFQIYCPTFSPKEYKRYVTAVEIYKDKTSASCSIEDASPNSTFSPIIIEESPTKNANGKRILERIDSWDSKKEVDINGNKGYVGTSWAGTNEQIGVTYSDLIYSDDKGTVVSIDSSYYDTDVLLRVARSMQ